MPAKNSRKIYSENSYYHVYNRGVEKRIIFQDEQDYAVFLSYLKTYLLPKNEKELIDKLANPNTGNKERGNILSLLRLNNFASEITLLAYCLMPNHFHLLLKQKSNIAMDKFLNSLGTRYTMYFNRRHKRVGRLYQNVYKAVLVNSDEQLLHLTRYIHRNPQPSLASKASKGQAFQDLLSQQPSSYPEYLRKRETEWVDTNTVLGYFAKNSPIFTYQSFVEQNNNEDISNDINIDINF